MFDALKLADCVANRKASGLTRNEVKSELAAKAREAAGLDLQNSSASPPPKGKIDEVFKL